MYYINNNSVHKTIYVLLLICLLALFLSCNDVQETEEHHLGIVLDQDLKKIVDLAPEQSIPKDNNNKSTHADESSVTPVSRVENSIKENSKFEIDDSSVKLVSPTALPKPIAKKTEKVVGDIGNVLQINYGGKLNLATNFNIEHQDVHMEFSPALALWGPGIVYSRMMRFNSDDASNMSPECDLCESWEMEDFSTFVFTLRDDAKWQNIFPLVDQQVTTSDVDFSLKRISELNQNNSPTLWSLSEIEVIDQSKIRLSTQFPDADFLLHLADGRSKIVSSKLFENKDGILDGPTIGSGPWVYESSNIDSVHKFSRNKDYFEPDFPFLDSLIINVIPDSDARIATYVATDELDVIKLEASEIEDFLVFDPYSDYLISHEMGSGIEIALNTNSEIFQDIEIRRAVFYALDPSNGNKQITPVDSFSSVGIPLISDKWMLQDEILKAFTNSPRGVKQILKDSQSSGPIEFTISVGDFGDSFIEYSKIIESQLLDAGFLVQVKILNRREFAEDAWIGGEYEMLIGPPAPSSFPNVFLTRVLHSEGIWNGTNITNSKIDELIESQIGLMDSDSRRQQIKEIQRLSMEQAHRFIPFTRINIWSWKNHVRGFEPVSNGYEYFYWAKTWID
tara:strand:- start:10104 stop:11966 length:1863 start_codon:yes stop_codon:yes gene_type:complete